MLPRIGRPCTKHIIFARWRIVLRVAMNSPLPGYNMRHIVNALPYEIIGHGQRTAIIEVLLSLVLFKFIVVMM